MEAECAAMSEVLIHSWLLAAQQSETCVPALLGVIEIQTQVLPFWPILPKSQFFALSELRENQTLQVKFCKFCK